MKGERAGGKAEEMRWKRQALLEPGARLGAKDFPAELQECTTTFVLKSCAPHHTFALKSCDFSAGAAGAHSACYFRLIKSYDFPVGAAADQAGIEPATLRSQEQARKPPNTSPQPKKAAKVLSFCTSAASIRAEGRARAPEKSQNTLSFCTSTAPIPAAGRFLHSVVGPSPPPEIKNRMKL